MAINHLLNEMTFQVYPQFIWWQYLYFRALTFPLNGVWTAYLEFYHNLRTFQRMIHIMSCFSVYSVYVGKPLIKHIVF